VAAHSDGSYQLDYPPLRLLAVALWARHEHVIRGEITGWEPGDRFNAPPLIVAAACDAVAAIGMFLLVRLWAKRWRAQRLGDDPASPPASEVAWICGLAAAALLWFNVSLLLDGYVWGQADGWLLPFFILAAYFASIQRWFWVGVFIGVGCLVKVQLLIVAPLFFLWPLFAGKPLASLRSLLGFALAAGLLLSPWLIHRDMSWYRISVPYGSRHFPQMTVDASNLPAIMSNKTYDWSLTDTIWNIHLARPHFAWAMTVRQFLIGIYTAAMLLSSLGAALHARRNSASILAALVAPWAVMFAVLPQMHPRYLVWAAALSAAMAGVSLGMTLLHLVVTALASEMLLRQLLLLNPTLAPRLSRALSGFHPHIAWAAMLCAAIFMYEALAFPLRRRKLTGR
jgi:hypothetical protein